MGGGVNGCRPLPIHTHSGRVDTDRAAPGDVLYSSRQVRWNRETKTRKEGITLESGIRWYRCRRHPAGAERRGCKIYGWIKPHGRVRHRERPKIRACDGLISKRDRHRSRGQILRLEHASKPDVVAGVDRKSVEVRRDRTRKLTRRRRKGEKFGPAIALRATNRCGKDSFYATGRKFQNIARAGGANFSNKEIANAVKSEPSWIICKARRESRLRSIRSKLENLAVSVIRSRYEKITGAIKSQADWPLIWQKGGWTGEDAPHACGSELEDRFVACICREKIAHAVKGEAEPLAGQCTKYSYSAARRDFEDGAGNVGITLIISHDKEIARAVELDVLEEVVVGEAVSKGAYHTARRNFQNTPDGITVVVETGACYEKIANAIKRKSTRLDDICNEGALDSSRRIFKNGAVSGRIRVVNGSEQVRGLGVSFTSSQDRQT